MPNVPEKFDNVSVVTKANVFFDGKVVSHTLFLGSAKKTLGLIYAGTYKFNTDAPERMDITVGSCRAKLAGEKDWEDLPSRHVLQSPRQIVLRDRRRRWNCAVHLLVRMIRG